MTNTQTLDTILHAMEQLIAGASAGAFAVGAMLVNVPLAFLIPSSSGHAALAMPLLTPLADFAGVGRPLTITAWILAHGLTLLLSPTNVVVVGGLAIAKVGFDRYLRFMWPLRLGLFLVAAAGAVPPRPSKQSALSVSLHSMLEDTHGSQARGVDACRAPRCGRDGRCSNR